MTFPLIPVILSGGAGTRLWPVSRQALPKPFMRLGDGRSLLRTTLDRAARLADAAALIVTNRDYYFLSRDELVDANPAKLGSVHFLLEPSARNTAPAIALATLAVAARHGEDALVLVLPADHLIGDEATLRTCVERACASAAAGYLVTFGICADSPQTGYGYIEAGAALGSGAFAVRRFVEKPAAERAREFIAAGNYYWNSGMFCFRAGDMLAAFDAVAPALAAGARQTWERSQARGAHLTHGAPGAAGDAIELDAASFSALESISIDYAVFEKWRRVAIVPGNFGWSDVGAWPEIATQFSADARGNRSTGRALFVDSSGCFVHAHDRLVAMLGLEDTVVIDTPDALLVMPKDRAEDVKQVVAAVQASGDDRHIVHATVARPWGTYTVLQEGPHFKLKRIEVKPLSSLSLQMHYYRNEHWIVVSGTARVTNGDRVYLLAANESTYIKAGARHRLENPGTLPLVIIEVQNGQYVGEDDIVRFDDSYGRAPAPAAVTGAEALAGTAAATSAAGPAA